jgi:hypothetical protein
MSPAIQVGDGHGRQQRKQIAERTHQKPKEPIEPDRHDIGLDRR